MGVLSAIAEIVRDLLIFTIAVTVLLVALIVVISRMPDGNPLKRLLTILSYRVGATAAIGMVAVPIEPIPGLDAVYDIGAPILLIWYWYTFFRDVRRGIPKRPPQPQIRRDDPL